MYKSLAENDELRQRWENERLGTFSQQERIEQKEQIHPSSCDEALAIWNKLDPDGAADTTEYRKAAQLYEKSTRINPDDLHAYIDAAMLYEILGDFEHSAELWGKAYQVRSDMTAYMFQQERLKTRAMLAKGMITGNEKAALLRKLGKLYSDVNKPEQGLEYLYEAVALDSMYVDGWMEIAGTAFKAGMYNEASDAVDKAIEIQPDLKRATDFKNGLKDILAQ